MFEIIGKITVGFVALVLLLVVAYNIYLVIRAVVLATDFTRWYLAQSKAYNPEYKMKHHVRGYLQIIGQMYNYSPDTTRIHKNGAVYKPFSRV